MVWVASPVSEVAMSISPVARPLADWAHVGNDLDGEAIEVRLLAPVAIRAGQVALLVLHELVELERARAHEVVAEACAPALDLFLRDDDVAGTVRAVRNEALGAFSTHSTVWSSTTLQWSSMARRFIEDSVAERSREYLTSSATTARPSWYWPAWNLASSRMVKV